MTDPETITRLTASQALQVQEAREAMGPAIAQLKRHAARLISDGHPAGAIQDAINAINMKETTR